MNRGLFSFVCSVLTITGLAFANKGHPCREPDESVPLQFPSTMLQCLPAEVAVWLHANRRRCTRVNNHWWRVETHPYRYPEPYIRLLVNRTGFGIWFRNQCRIFDRRGRLRNANYFTERFVLQRMCRRLVTRTRRRLLCRKHIDSYLIPELRDIVASYV